ncbi:MAG TPA: YbhB/YbcL family Raf kinase inhibitor-like protein [Polyangiales bacterium]|nr:YbhB/YbcL family Raf kinase inhibitor-like protein [Polyangiales bacterium]
MRIAVVGDIHLLWDERDTQAIDECGYDLVLFVGDLAGFGLEGALRVAHDIAQLRTPALVLPGNHDAVTAPQLAAEVLMRTPDLAREALALRMTARVQQLATALGPVTLCGYSLHPFDAHRLTVLAARPHSIGGPRLAFRRYLASRFNVRRMTDSVDRLCALFDAVPTNQQILVLAHNGPTGLGSARHAIFGCDFRTGDGDWGDPDLGEALQYARETGKHVLGVVAGHMHHAVRGGGERAWLVERYGLVHVNAARVPRYRAGAQSEERHHVCLTLEDGRVKVEPVWLPIPRASRKRNTRGPMARARRTRRRALVTTGRALKTLSFPGRSATLRGSATKRGAMQLESQNLIDGQRLPAANAMGIPAAGGAQPGANRSPHLKWSGAPAGTKSFAVVCVDRDVPTKPDDVNKPDRTVPYDLPRTEFVHWLLVDVPASTTELKEAQDAEGMTPRGKAPGKVAHGLRGLNDYTGWFKGDENLEGQWAGYDGPWPPFNDERLHHYTFSVYALDVATLGVSGAFTLADARKAMQGHVLAEAKLTVSYAIYAKAR